MNSETRDRVQKMLGQSISSVRKIDRGYTAAERWIVSLANGKSAFIKIGATVYTAQVLRLELEIYKNLKSEFVPEFLGWSDETDRPLLALEDLSGYHWPPPWEKIHIEAVLKSLNQLHKMRLPLKSFTELHSDMIKGWELVKKDPKPFLSLGLVTEKWLQKFLPILLEIESNVVTDGDSPTHWDVRSDNICISQRGAILVDWNGCCNSNPDLDIGFWLPSLASEGGPAPEKLLPGKPEIAVWVCGFFAARAGLPPILDAPKVRTVQLAQLKPALAWAIREAKLIL